MFQVGPVTLGDTTAECGAGQRATGGGFGSGHVDLQVMVSRPVSSLGPDSDEPTGWRVAVAPDDGFVPAGTTFTVYVICAGPDEVVRATG